MTFEEKVRLDNEKYRKAFQQYGDSPKSLLWGEGPVDRQKIRYYELLKYMNLSDGITLLDIGCGFGGLYPFCRDYFHIEPVYTGIDYCEEFIETAKRKYSAQCTLIQGDFLLAHDLVQYDYCVTSGIFNISNGDDDTGEQGYLYQVVKKMFELCRTAASFNFITDKVQYKNPGVSYYSPAKIIDFCYSLSRNIVFDNSCMPFEATVTVFKDDKFSKSGILCSFEQKHMREWKTGVFCK